MREVILKSTGMYLPEQIVTNAELVARLKEAGAPDDTTEEWIVEHMGVEERHIAAPGEHTSEMAEMASRVCLEKAGVHPGEIDLFVVSTVSGDYRYPATANLLQGRLGNTRAWSFDINAGCSGFIYGLAVVKALIQSGASDLAMLVGTEKMSELYDPNDRTSFPLAGDGAAAVLLRGVNPNDNPRRRGLRGYYSKSDGQMADLLMQRLGGTSYPLTPENILDPGRFLWMDGRAVYKQAVRKMKESIVEVLEQVRVPVAEVDWFIGHQANWRILETVAEKLDIPEVKMYANISRYANTTAATIPICLDELAESGQLQPGHKVVLFAFGTGFTWGAHYLVWGS